MRRTNLVLVALGLLQGVAAASLLCWALPLFFDPPPGNSVDRAIAAIREITQAHPEHSFPLRGFDKYVEELFDQRNEGVFVALAAALTLLCSSLGSLALARRGQQ